MPCITDTAVEADVALQLLNMVTPLPAATSVSIRETTQTDHINKRLLETFLEHINADNISTPFSLHSLQKQNEETDDFED